MRGGPLRKTVDLSAIPPGVVFDALFEASVRGRGAGAGASVLFRRFLGALWPRRGEAYGAPPA